jgi:hypothetical protein
MYNLLILTREQLLPVDSLKPFEEILHGHQFSTPMTALFAASVILFIDGARVQVLKDRSGRGGCPPPYEIPIAEALELLKPGMYFRLPFPDATDRQAWHFRAQNLSAMTYDPREEIPEPV